MEPASSAWLTLLASAVAPITIFAGVWQLRNFGFSRNALMSLLLGIAFCAAVSGLSYFQHHILSGVIQSLGLSEQPRSRPVPKSELSVEDRRRFDQLMGRIAFRESGRLRSWVDPVDGTKLYVPTQTEIEGREELVAGVARLEVIDRGSLIGAFAIWAIGLLSGLFGLFWMRRNAP